MNRLLEEEKEKQKHKEELKREKERRVLAENQSFVRNLTDRKQKEKEDDVHAFNDYKSRVENEDNKRQMEKMAREDRIKRLLNRVPAITVEHQPISTVNHSEIEDIKLKEHQQRREQYEESLLQKKREDARKMNEEMKRRLDWQLEEKKVRKH